MNYIAFSGGGEALAALLGGQVTAAISGYSEFAAAHRVRPIAGARDFRALAAAGLAAPPLGRLRSNVALHNWRGVVGAPQVDAAARQRSPI